MHSRHQTHQLNHGTILAVDDTLQNLQLVGEILETNGYQVILAMDGEQALKVLAEQEVDLVLLDIVMPEMDGFEVCRRIKANPATQEIPVIFLTVHGDIDSVLTGFRLGAVDYVTKPVHKAELLARVQTHLELRNAHKHLTKQNEELLKLHSERTEFLGIAAHGMKNPLTGIRLSAELINRFVEREPLEKEKIVKNVRQIIVLSDRMLSTVKNCLEADEWEKGNVLLHLEMVNVVTLMQDVLDRFYLQAEAKDITLQPYLPEMPLIVDIDKNAFGEIVENLVSNALKYSPHGKYVWISLSASYAGLRVLVKDEGPGISEEDRKRMFGKYARLTAQPTGGEHSTGLGLSIVKKMVDALQGKIWCESEVGSGATFIVELPLKIHNLAG
jgi:two-component system sensor histidine kinase/response regulator